MIIKIKKRDLLLFSVFILILASIPIVYAPANAVVIKGFFAELWIANQNPTIKFDAARSSSLAGIDPTEAGTTLVWFVFNVTDPDGEDNINETGTFFNLTLGTPGSRQERGNRTCVNISKVPADDLVIFNCSVALYWFDNSSSNWVVNATGRDINDAQATNASNTFTYNELSAMSFAVAYINFSNVNLGANDQAAGSPLILNNTGNDDFDEINITAADLYGVTVTSEFVGVSNFTVNFTNANAGLGTRLTRSPQRIIIDDAAGNNLTLPHGHTRAVTDYNDNVIGARGNQSLYFWVDVPATGLSAQKYNATWNVTVLDRP